jgi:MFS family permease
MVTPVLPPDVEPRHDPYAAFRFPAYRAYMIGSLVSLVGTRVQAVAIGWDIYDRTGEALALGIVGAVQAVPMIGLALPAGWLADHFSRKGLIVACLLGTSLTSLMLAGISAVEGSVAWMYAVLLLDSAFLAIARPARQAVLPGLVPKAIFANALAWRSSLFQIASIIGPAVGGVVIIFSVASAYVLSAATTLIFAALFARVALPQIIISGGRPTVASLLGGVTFMWKNRTVLAATLLDLFAVLLGGATYLLPIFAADILNVGKTGFGLLHAAPAAGSLAMALLLTHVPPMKRAGRNLLLTVVGFGLATIVFGLSRNYLLSWAMLFLTGFFDNVSVIIRHSLVQMLTPDHMRGRVSAVNGVFISSSNELGGVESSLVAHWFGPVISVVSGGVGTIVVVALTAWLAPGLRRLGRIEHLTPTEDKPPGSAPAPL